MSGNASTYLQAARLNWRNGTAYPSAPTNVYVALFVTNPAQNNTSGVEVSGTGYVRQAIAASGWGAITGSGPWQIATAGVTSFGTAGSDWGTITGFGLYDASTGGNLLYVAAFAQSIVVSSGAPVSFAAGAITITETGTQYLAEARLNWYKGTAYPTPPSDLYIALYTTMPTLANTGGVEASWTGYARQSVAASTGWSALSGTDPTQISNAALIDYGTAGSGPETVVGWGALDAATGGNLVDLYTLPSAQTVNSGADVSFAVGALGVSED